MLGAIVRLQVQLASLKQGQRPARWYDPAPLRALPALILDEGGVVGQGDGAAVLLDVHHRDHPASKNRAGTNDISVGFTSHYAALRARCGDHLGDGIAGENILIATARAFGEEAFPNGLVMATADGQRRRLERVVVAEPCVEFTRFALRYTADTPSDASVTATLDRRRGLRGYYATYQGAPARLQLGDRVFLP